MIRVGIIGYGVVGKHRHQCLKKRGDAIVTVVCDKTLQVDRLDDGVKVAASYKKLLQEKLEAVFVCVPNNIAPMVVMDAMQKGLHVFCEKPPGKSVSDIIKIRECEKNHHTVKLMYGFNHRFHLSVKDALDLIKTDALGRVINIKGVYGKSKLITFNQTDWRTKREIAGGGVLLDQGIHMVDLMRLFAGEFTQIHSFVSNGFWGFDVEDNAFALMRTADGVIGMLHSSATQWRHRFELDVTLERGSLILSGILSGSKSYGAETLRVVWAEEGDNGDPKEQITRYNVDPSWDEEVAKFICCIRDGLPIQSGSSDEALKTMQLVEKIYLADPVWADTFQLQPLM